MIKAKENYQCVVCGNAVKVIRGGMGTLVCCGQNMLMLKKVELKRTKRIA